MENTEGESNNLDHRREVSGEQEYTDGSAQYASPGSIPDCLQEKESGAQRGTMIDDSNKRHVLKCDVCIDEYTICRYCRTCRQKLCSTCERVHGQLGATREHQVEPCMREIVTVPKPVTEQLKSCKSFSTEESADYLLHELGVQVCVGYEDDRIDLLASSSEILDLAIDTVIYWVEPNKAHTTKGSKQLQSSGVKWIYKGEQALTIIKLFHRELCALEQDHDVKISVYKGEQNYPWSDICFDETPGNITSPANMEGTAYYSGILSRNQISSSGNISINHSVLYGSQTGLISNANDNDLSFKLICHPDDYVEVDSKLQHIIDAILTLSECEIIRPKQDEFRINLYALVKETDDRVMCHIEAVDSVYKLVVKARDAEIVADIKQEFLSLFCKECTVCHNETSRPTYLECKHILCHDCVKTSACYGDGLRCPLCSNEHREKTPILSLQLHCIQMLDNRSLGSVSAVRTKATVSSYQSTQVNTSERRHRNKLSSGKVHHYVKIPKFIVNKWKRATGGLGRLRNHIENSYGIQVTGTGDHLKIYGYRQDILDLAILSLENLHEKAPQSGVTHLLRDKTVQWRFYGEQAQIAYFLFNQDLMALTKRFKTVTMQTFTESEPAIVDVVCEFKEHGKVKYEMEELENDIRNMYVDEFIQPKNFYHNIKVRDFIQSKRRDGKVHCSLVDRNNLNVVVIKGRKREYVTEAKDQLSHW